MMQVVNEEIKVSTKDIPFVARKIRDGFLEDGWTNAGYSSEKRCTSMAFLDSDKKFIAIISLEKKSNKVFCSYKVDEFDSKTIETDGEDEDGNPMLAVGAIAALAASAIAFPMATLGAAIIGLGAAIFSDTTENEPIAQAISIIRRQLTDIEEAAFAQRRINNARRYDIFISYRHDKGRDYGRMLYEAYKKKGKKVFFYPPARNRIVGPINDATREAVNNSKVVLVILTEGFFDKCINKDDGCRAEIEAALVADKPIIPIRLPGYRSSAVPDGVPEHLLDAVNVQGVSIASLPPDVTAISKINFKMRVCLRKMRNEKVSE